MEMQTTTARVLATWMAAGVLVLVAAACGAAQDVVGPVDDQVSSTSPEAATTSDGAVHQTLPDPTPTGSTGDDGVPPDDGISVDEAEATGVLTGEFDALLVGPEFARENADGCLEVQLRLTNVGASDDTYRIVGDEAATDIDPAEVSLASGASEQLTVTVCDRSYDGLTIEVYSNGLDDLVARADL